MKPFTQYLIEAGQAPGSLELLKTPLEVARVYAEKEFAKNDRRLDVELPNFNANYELAKAKAASGKTKRKDMPVIDAKDIKLFQEKLRNGEIDIQGPWAEQTDIKDPFPEGLSGEEADLFLKKGLRVYDGSKPDDRVKVVSGRVAAIQLVPIQAQIYFSKSIEPLSKHGVKDSMNFHKTGTYYICSSDYRIIDGHHRFMSAMLMDPSMKVRVLMIDLPIHKLLPLTLAFGDAIGNKRNL